MGLFVSSRAVSIIENELLKSSTYVKDTGDAWMICCPFHSENTPSCRISKGVNVPPGIFYCFGCKEKGKWNKLARKMGLKTIEDEDSKALGSVAPNLSSSLKRIKHDMLEVEDLSHLSIEEAMRSLDFEIRGTTILPLGNMNWRGVSFKILNKMKVRKYVDTKHLKSTTYLLIPIIIQGSIKGVVRARWKKEKKLTSYYNSRVTPQSSSSWVKTFGLLGYDRVRKTKYWKKDKIVYVVEGPRDAINLISMGYAAVAILGATSWSKSKRELIQQLNPKRVVVMMDGDDPGRAAGRNIYNSIKSVMQVEKIKLNEGMDPGALTRKQMRQIHKSISK